MSFLFQLLFRKQIDAYQQVVINAQSEAASKIREIQNRSNIKAEQYELVRRAFSDFSNSKILGLEKNKAGEEVFVSEHLYLNSLDLYLYGKSYEAINCHPRIMCTINDDYSSLDKFVHIDDIIEEDCNFGNGSILIRYLIREAKELGSKYIDGSLSRKDKDHFDRLEHFYQKHGFDVSFNDDRISGHINLTL